jgi:2-phosphosulfolactate phosphatase
VSHLRRLDVAVTPAALAPERLPGATVLVIDVLRATTSITTALAHGCRAIVPVASAEEARRRAAHYPAGEALVAGEWLGEAIPGFDLGNSPRDFSAARVGDKTVVLTTSNGTGALLAARSAAAVGVAALVNLSAAAAWAVAEGRDVLVVCAGSRGKRALEDEVCAGLLVARMASAVPGVELTPAADAMASAARPYEGRVAALAGDAPWARRLIAAGHGEDVDTCLVLDTFAFVPAYLTNVDKVVRGPR